jgi:outer membrane lipoprotein carrier protein
MDSEKYWRRLRLKNNFLSAFLWLFAALQPVWAQDSDTLSGEAVLDRFLTAVQSFSADFEQEIWTADQDLLETAQGAFLLQRPDRFAWNYRVPDEQRILADGRNLWIYDVELEQATVTSLDSLGQANPAMLLSGDGRVRENFDIVESFVLKGQDWIRLKPKQQGSDFSSILLAFRDGLPTELEFVDGLAQTTRIVFSNIQVNPELDAANFEFTPPPGVDVYGDAG